jgi:hypothetical protein
LFLVLAQIVNNCIIGHVGFETNQEQEMNDLDIMLEVNTMTPAKTARLTADFTRAAGAAPILMNVRMISPALDMTVGFDSELAAFKLAYYFREHAQSRVRVEEASVPGVFLVILTPKA